MNENQTGLTPLETEKPRKYGGAPTKQGLELFTKLALTKDNLRIAGVLVGSGIVADDVYIGDMTQLVEPAGVGTCSEPIRNGATVNMTVEVRSDLNKDLPDGMTIREFLIQAWDGEEKIAIYYGCLADYPQYIAPWEEGYLDVRRYPVSIRLAPSVKVDLDDTLPGVVMTIDDIKDYCISTLLPQLLTASQNQIVNHNLAPDSHPDLREKIETAQQTADDAASAAEKAQQTADSAVQAAENNSGGCALRITFAEVFAGQTYTVSGGEESYTGTVPEGLVVQVKLKQCGMTYTIHCTDADGEEYSTTVVTGPYFGQYTASLLPFSATLTVTTSPGASVTAVCEGQSVSGTAGENGSLSLTLPAAGTYTVTAELDGRSVRGTVEANENGGSYTLTLDIPTTVPNEEAGVFDGHFYSRIFEPEDWTGGALRVPQTTHGIQPRQSACIGTLHQRVDRTALDYLEQTAAQGRTAITNAVKAALNANSSAPGTYPTAEDGHVQLTWNQVQCYILDGTLLAAEAAASKASEKGFNWQNRDTTGAPETATLDAVLTAAYLPALGGATTGLDNLCTAAVLQGLRLRRKATGVGTVTRYDLDGAMVANTWAAMESRIHWDLETKALVLEGSTPFAGELMVVG